MGISVSSVVFSKKVLTSLRSRRGPFMNFELLLKAVETAHELKIPSTFVETNCYWCPSDEVTREKLQLLKEKGLKGILISVNPFYLEYVPFERTERAIRISQEVFGKNVMVYLADDIFPILMSISAQLSRIEDFSFLDRA